jgi:disulfide oxidoreductase YuzD
MLVFVDESGDPGLKLDEGSSKYFIVTLVLFEDDDEADSADLRINLLRRELNLSSRFEFHFSENKSRIRTAFLHAIEPYNFFYFSIVINKEKLYGKGFKFKESFYKYACGLVFENAKQYLYQAVVVFDGSGSKDFRQQLHRYLKRKVGDEDKSYSYIKKVKIQDSSTNNLIQMTDIICGAIRRSFRSDSKHDQQYRNIIRHREIYVQFWPK